MSVTADGSNAGLVTLFLMDVVHYFICLWSLQLTPRIVRLVFHFDRAGKGFIILEIRLGM